MEYNKCSVTVRLVDTAIRPQPTELKVLSVCELMRPGNDAPFKFTQTFDIRCVPWITTEFRIVETYSKFEDEIEDDYFPKAVSVQIIYRKITSKIAKVSDRLRLPDDKNTGVDKLKELCPKRTDEIINTKKVFDKKINEKPQGKSINRHEELKNAGKKSTACSSQASIKNIRKPIDRKMENTIRVLGG
jgi:hypothetical protein